MRNTHARLLACVLSFFMITTANAADNDLIKPNGQAAWVIQTASGRFPISAADEVPVRGGFSKQIPALEVIYADGTRDCALTFAASKITEQDGSPTLRIDLEDREYGLKVSAFTRVFADLDILEKWMVIENAGAETIKIENAQSAALTLEKDEYDLIHLAGVWGREFMPQRGRLTPGLKTIQVRDFSEFNNPPWFAVRPVGDDSEVSGPVWFGGLRYSGNWRIDFEKSFNGGVQITGGINFWDTHWNLRPGERFETPKMVLGFSSDGMTGASLRMHRYINERLMRSEFRDRLRPVLYNSWYATTFDVNEEHQLALARVAKEIGVELFVIDDGWFKGRVNDRGGLGDWTVDRNKFPNGLNPMIEKINAMGLEFGIWVEPEMVNPDSDLYRAHPDWVFHYPKRARHEQRNQLMLNLAREDVYDYLLESMSDLLSKHNIRFIKWDRNRALSDPGWPDAPEETQREVRIRYMTNLYRLIDTLRERFPNVWFETCSGGGGRPDMGMLERMDQTWASDNTDPLSRIMIQYGYLHAFPARTMVSWVTHDNWTGIEPSLAFRFDVAMAGVLGIGFDITKWSEAERQEAARHIALYKEIRPVVQMGEAFRLRSPFENHQAATQYISRDGSESVVFMYNLWQPIEGSVESERQNTRLRLRGLDPHETYQVRGRNSSGFHSGRELMEQGLRWPIRGPQKSTILQIRKGRPTMTEAKVMDADSESGWHPARNILDGNSNTIWHTEYGDRQPEYPHWIRVDLGREIDIRALRLLPRQGSDTNGWIRDVAVYMSKDSIPVPNNDRLSESEPELLFTLDNNDNWKTLELPEKQKARYLLLVMRAPQNPDHPWASLAELEIVD